MSPYALPSHRMPPVGLREYQEEIRVPLSQFKGPRDKDITILRMNLAANSTLFGWPPTRLVLVDALGRSWLERWRALGNSCVKSTRRARGRRRGDAPVTRRLRAGG